MTINHLGKRGNQDDFATHILTLRMKISCGTSLNQPWDNRAIIISIAVSEELRGLFSCPRSCLRKYP